MSKTTANNIGHSDGECTMKLRATKDKVVLKKFEVYRDRIVNGIFVPVTADLNFRMSKAEVVSIGEEAAKDLEGLSVGDIVLYDHLAAFYDTHPIVVCRAENIICKVDEDNDKKN